MSKKLLSLCLSALFLVPFVVMADLCDATPKAGKIYEAGWCYEEFNRCYKLPEGVEDGDCFIEV
ncbi:hypothetical protein [Belliella aquatica]|uniref:Uncharacterized protein n=1 Tax=Belliella aquatica TaxID=1323734 RepID=A0ABQ1MLX3_9BACT|nr:hypothetical protein [Belliella aquatica]MCH7405292.1 hypothetical protein [Belliella aquatica]GGC42837.1 hypothetical protein GCM10010993_21750 [Belliella aquatica]